MAKFTVTRYLDSVKANRLDAEYFHPEMVKAINIINSKKNNSFNIYARFIKKGCFDMPPTNYTDELNSIPFIRSGNMKNIFFSDDVKHITKEAHAKELKTELQKRDLVLSKIGTIGDMGINLRWDKINCSQNTIAVKIKNSFKEISPFLAIYINSYYGQVQLQRSSQGQVQDKLILEDLKELLVVEFSLDFQRKISCLVETSFYLSEQSKSEASNAQSLLLQEIGLNSKEIISQNVFIKKYSDVIESERMDAEYFQPKYDKIINAIKAYSGGYDTLGNLVGIKKSKEVGSGEYISEGIPFIRVSNISPFEISEEKNISEELYHKLKKHQPQQGEILLSKDGSPGIAHYLKEVPKKMIVSSAILRLENKKDKINSECLTMILNSILTQQQVNRDIGGSIILHWRPDQVEKTLIPILTKEKQLDMQEKVIESLNLYSMSKQLLENAKRAVEIAIEKNEKEALKWLDSQEP